MAGQRLSNLHIEADYHFNPLALHMGPRDLLAFACQIIASWSSVQAHLGNAFAEMVGARSRATVIMYSSFDSFAVQRQMLVTAATELLPKRDSEVFRATLTVIERAAKERHRFAHWIYGSFLNAENDNILLLADPKHVWRLRVATIHYRRRRIKTGDAARTQPRLDRRDIWAYKTADIRRVLDQVDAAERHAWMLQLLAFARSKERPHIRRRLLSEPQIRLALDAERQRKSKPKKAPPRPPRVSKRARREAALARRKQRGS